MTVLQSENLTTESTEFLPPEEGSDGIALQEVVSTTCEKFPSIVTNEKLNAKFRQAYEKDDFFAFKKLLEKTYFDDSTEEKLLKLSLKKRTTIFDYDAEKGMSLYDEILSNNNNHSAKYICLIGEEYKLWESSWHLSSKDPNGLNHMSYVIKSPMIENFLSFLMFDWHNPDRNFYEDSDVKYFLCLKNDQFKEFTGKSIIERLYEIIDVENVYHEISLRIIYEFLYELDGVSNENVDDESDDDSLNGNDPFINIQQLANIEFVMSSAFKSEIYREKILKILITFWNIKDNNYRTYKEQLLKVSDFFKLALQLKEHNYNIFEEELESYIKEMQKNYGHFYETILKADVRLLLHIVKREKMYQVESFIFNKCPNVESNSNVLSNFSAYSKFNNQNIYPFNANEDKILHDMEEASENIIVASEKMKMNTENKTIILELQKEIKHQENIFLEYYRMTDHKQMTYSEKIGFFGSYATYRNLLFERRHTEESLFEKILMKKGSAPVIDLVWHEFELWRKEKILIMKNPKGKLLIDFVILSKDEENLISFLMPKFSRSDSLVKRKYFIKLQNDQFRESAEGKKMTFFEHYLNIKNNKIRDSFFEVVFYLLEEMEEITNIKDETCVELFLDHTRISNLQDSLKFINDEDKFEHLYDCDKLLKYIGSYWTEEDKNYYEYKEKLIKVDPLFEMICLILEDKEQEFIENFHSNLNKLVKYYKKRYKKKEANEKFTQRDVFILFRTAIRKNRKQIINCILNFDTFETLDFKMPHFKKPTEGNIYTAQKLLEHGYNLGDESIPPDWITPQVMEDFLDSQVTMDDHEMVKLKTSFLVCPFDRKFKVKNKNDVDDMMLFWEVTDSFNFILKNECLKDLILHPVLSTFINLKSYKYQLIYEWNFFIFFFLYMLPFGLLITYHSFNNFGETFSEYFMGVLQGVCISSTTFLTIREIIQLFWIAESKIKYFKKKTNQLELIMIILSWIIIVFTLTLNVDDYLEYFSFISTILIISSTIILLSMLPFPSVPLYTMMLKNVGTTFLRFFCFFVFILFSFSICFCVVFRPKSASNSDGSKQMTNGTENTDGEVYQNFDTLLSSFFKTVLMLSGEYTIEPFTLSASTTIIFFIFVITSFILFNLILGLAIADVQDLRNHAEMLNLHHEGEKFIESARKWLDIFKKYELETKNINELTWWKRLSVKLMRRLLINYCYIHKIEKFYVNLKTKEITLNINRKQCGALSKYSGGARKCLMDQETLNRVKKILKDRNDREFAAICLKGEFDQKAEAEKIMKECRMQTEKLDAILNRIK